MKIGIVIASTGRPSVLREMLLRLARQTRAADRVIVVGAAPGDFPSGEEFPGVAFLVAAKGSSKQRNRGLDALSGDCGLVIFFDDDFVPAKDFLFGAERLMTDHPEIAAASGQILADGKRTAGISFTEADRLVAAYEAKPIPPVAPQIEDQPGAYGCNMIVRISALQQARFDEALPLYGWLEDLDLSAQLARHGRVVLTDLCAGVHLGTKNGRSPGLQIGYSHIANPLYLARKGAISWRRATLMALRVLIANGLRAPWPEPFIDRRGRLAGNLLAIGDLFAGRLHPLRVLTLTDSQPANRIGRALR